MYFENKRQRRLLGIQCKKTVILGVMLYRCPQVMVIPVFVKSNGDVHCFGANFYGQVIDWSSVSSAVSNVTGGNLEWNGILSDKVSSGPQKDGTPDGLFTLTLKVEGIKTVTSILLKDY